MAIRYTGMCMRRGVVRLICGGSVPPIQRGSDWPKIQMQLSFYWCGFLCWRRFLVWFSVQIAMSARSSTFCTLASALAFLLCPLFFALVPFAAHDQRHWGRGRRTDASLGCANSRKPFVGGIVQLLANRCSCGVGAAVQSWIAALPSARRDRKVWPGTEWSVRPCCHPAEGYQHARLPSRVVQNASQEWQHKPLGVRYVAGDRIR